VSRATPDFLARVTDSRDICDYPVSVEQDFHESIGHRICTY